jgi:hypothetical protein
MEFDWTVNNMSALLTLNCVRVEVFTALTVKNAVFWDIKT